MAYSILDNKLTKPTPKSLGEVLGKTMKLWDEIHNHCETEYDKISAEWNFSGEKYGWTQKILMKKRVLVRLTPHEKYLTVGLVFGGKAIKAIEKIKISPEIRGIIAEAPIYGEGTGVAIDLKYRKYIKDIFKLIKIKVEN